MRRRRHRLHLLRFGQPSLYGKLVEIFRTRAAETGILTKNSRDVAMTQARSAGNGLNVPLRERTKPAPRSAQHQGGACDDTIDAWLACEKGRCECIRQ